MFSAVQPSLRLTVKNTARYSASAIRPVTIFSRKMPFTHGMGSTLLAGSMIGTVRPCAVMSME